MNGFLSNSDLQFHFHSKKGRINDPNVLSYFGGQYHIFYQHLPDSDYPNDTPMHWGHAVTKDFCSFEELKTAIDPDTEYDSGGVRSGTATEKDGVLYAFYFYMEIYRGIKRIRRSDISCAGRQKYSDFTDPRMELQTEGKMYRMSVAPA